MLFSNSFVIVSITIIDFSYILFIMYVLIYFFTQILYNYLFQDREALVSLLCDFVEAMNPGLLLTRNPVILKDRDLAGELKDVWLAVQNKREREKGLNQDVMYKVGVIMSDLNVFYQSFFDSIVILLGSLLLILYIQT